MMTEPKGWAKCPEMGVIVADIFVPFKVPFGPDFTPELAIRKFQENDYDVGLWIDLTNTRRYYRSYLVKNKKIRYEKIFVTGKCRQPGIYRQEYIDELLRMFADEDDDFKTITAPPKPDWSRDENHRSFIHHRGTSSSDQDNLIGCMNDLRI
ncbi:hypothetical protein DERP_000165 [Dermatophagoides pteronyssinus]|uniref:Uncharacterized protein n=1 Tax=Dermatophagoides pteronyssinus TaxID=6956 RepID=A0ABQ8IZH5_DERPT|nr:hypothetical protein DERP_000165 [Dermatophagoides pteronyssinus]